MSFSLKAIEEKLGGLWEATGSDWVLSLHHILTEPVCPTAAIHPEGWHITRYRVDCDTIEESLQKAVDLVHAEIIERRIVGSYAPFSNPDDDAFAKWLYARADGSDERLPDVPCRELPREFEWILDGFIADNKAGIEKLRTEQSATFVASYVSARILHYLNDARLDYEAADALVARKLNLVA